MPTVKKIQPAEHVNQSIKVRKDLMQQIDLYKALTNADSRNAVINEIIAHYFNTAAGISPAMQNVLLKIVPPIPIPENAEALIELLMSDASDEDVARVFLDAMLPLFTQQITMMRTALRQIGENEE
jgi:hypothetical protein